MSIDLFRAQVEAHLRKSIEEMGEKNTLRDACEYALLGGGKRLRPILVLLIADALGLGADVMPAALSVEFFHTASLIADDLPCMDNDDLRRERPSLHKVFGESVAILSSYALIAEGYGGIYKNSQKHPESAVLCLEAATRCAGINGATNGQFLDLYPPDSSLDTIKKVIYQKTVTLFEISFVFGWLFGGGSREKLPQVRASAYHLGMAFQVADDLLDAAEDPVVINMATAFGEEEAVRFFNKEVEAWVVSLKELGLWSAPFEEIVAFLFQYKKIS